jgi:hypothetical protein
MKWAYDAELRLLLFREAVRARVKGFKRTFKKKSVPWNPIANHPRVPDGIAIAAMFKNEGPYIAEWLEFHLMVGVRHIYLYENGSTDNWRDAVAPYIRDGVVTLIPWQNFYGRQQQTLAYDHAFANFGPDYKWMAFIDLDEFMFPTRGNSLEETMKTLEHLPAISLPWFMYGPGGHEKKPDGLVIKNFIERAAWPPIPAQYTLYKFKSIVNPRAIIPGIGIHTFATLEHGAVLINDRGQIYPHHQMRVLDYASADHIRLNHYFTRSEEEFQNKLRRGRAGKAGRVDMHALDQRVAQYHRCVEKDTEIWRFVPELERRLAARFGKPHAAEKAEQALVGVAAE